MRGVRKFVDELHYLGTPDRRRRVEARDAELTQEVVEKCVKAYVAFVDARESWDNREPVDAIRAVATPPESPREPAPNIIVNGKRVYREVVQDDGYTRIEFTKEDTSGETLCWQWIKEESPRERLGRALYVGMGWKTWEGTTEKVRESYRKAAAAVIEEQARIEEEGKP